VPSGPPTDADAFPTARRKRLVGDNPFVTRGTFIGLLVAAIVLLIVGLVIGSTALALIGLFGGVAVAAVWALAAGGDWLRDASAGRFPRGRR
jgi:hypothetical protein